MADETETVDVEALMDEGIKALDAESENKDEEVESTSEEAQDDDTDADATETETGEEDDITAEAIREALGDKSPTDVSDDDLVKLYGEKEEKEEETKWDRPWDFVDADGKSIEAEWKRATLDARLKYQADGQEQTHSVDDLLRLASRLPNVEHRAQELQEQRNTAARSLAAAQAIVEERKKDKEMWTWIMADATGQRFVEAQEKFQSAGPGGPTSTETPEEEAPQYTAEQEARRQRLLSADHSALHKGNGPSLHA